MRLHEFLPPGESTETAHDRGKDLRATVPRSSHAELHLAPDRDPLATLERAHADRIEELVGIRVARMTQSPFAYYRATADVMTADLAHGARTGVDLVICGDAHITNFGLYASPERRMVFDLNDFDEAGIGPWEWDVKRLTVSVDLVLRDRGADRDQRRDALVGTVSAYRDSLRALCSGSALDRYFFSVDAEWLADSASGKAAKRLDRSVARARRRTSERVLAKVSASGDSGDRRIEPDPPILVPLGPEALDEVRRRFEAYLGTLATDRALLLSQFRVVDLARRVVGVGSVGTRCSIVLLEGPSGEPLVLQTKEARPSVLATSGGFGDVFPEHAPSSGREGFRIVSCQRVLQSASDPFLGWTVDDDGTEFYWRQFRDMKGEIDLDDLPEGGIARYSRLCARLLGRAHAQSPDAVAVAGYLGRGDVFADSVADWALAYGDRVIEDYQAFRAAVEQGRFPLGEEYT